MKKTVSAALAGLALSVLFSGCGSSGVQSTTPPPPPVTVQVSVTPIGAALTPGNSTQFTATITGDTSVTWSVNGMAGGDPSIGTIDATGDYTAPSTTQSVAVTVTAASVMLPSVTSSATAYVVVPGQVTTT